LRKMERHGLGEKKGQKPSLPCQRPTCFLGADRVPPRGQKPGQDRKKNEEEERENIAGGIPHSFYLTKRGPQKKKFGTLTRLACGSLGGIGPSQSKEEQTG